LLSFFFQPFWGYVSYPIPASWTPLFPRWPLTARPRAPQATLLDRERTRTRTGRIWPYVGDRNRPYIVYDYTGNHSREGPEEFLKGYNGYLQPDAQGRCDGAGSGEIG
jgi:hypothetical protein